jgi:hypothetical protein
MRKRQVVGFPQEAVLFSTNCSYQVLKKGGSVNSLLYFLGKYFRHINFKLIIESFGVWPKHKKLFISIYEYGGLLCVRN